MREKLDTLLAELRRLKKEGVSSVLLEENTLDQLAEQADRVRKSVSTAPKSEPVETQAKAQATLLPMEPAPVVHQAEKIVHDYHTLPSFELPDGSKKERWDWLRERVLSCPVCNNHVKPGKKVVFGVGNIDADIFFCGEAPGADEEIEGIPFIGPAGQLLTRIISATGLTREDVYIGNIMNWRPETDTPYGNRPPNQEEMDFCLPYLRAQVQVVQPKIIVALGATAVNGLLGYNPKRSITRSRGEWHDFEGTPTIITYHPSYVLRNGTNRVKRQIWEDMLAVMERLSMPISEKQRGYFL